jgi:hypothetical protein
MQYHDLRRSKDLPIEGMPYMYRRIYELFKGHIRHIRIYEKFRLILKKSQHLDAGCRG